MTATASPEVLTPAAVRIPSGIEVLPTPAVRAAEAVTVLVTSIVEPSTAANREALLHRPVQARFAYSIEGGYITDAVPGGNQIIDFVYGAVQNPAPVEGAFYMHPVAASTAAGAGMDHGLHYVTQYRNGQWRIVLPVNADNTLMWSSALYGPADPQTAPYYRVKAPLNLIPENWAYTPDALDEVTDPSTQMVRRGWESAVPEPPAAAPAPEPAPEPLPEYMLPHVAEGAVPNETPQHGVLYVIQPDSGSTSRLEFAFWLDGNNWAVSHNVSIPRGSTEWMVNGQYMVRTDLLTTDGALWARAKLADTPAAAAEGTPARGRLVLLRSALGELEDRWEKYEADLNEVAEDNSWCPDYERVLEPLGMKGRTNKTGTVRFTIAWTGDVSFDSVSGAQDTEIGDALDFPMHDALSITALSLSASGRVQLTRDGVRLDEDGDPKDVDEDDYGISDDDIVDAIKENMAYGTSVDVESFDIDGTYVIEID